MEHNAGSALNNLKFMNSFTKLFSDHFTYLKLKNEKKDIMAKIDQAI